MDGLTFDTGALIALERRSARIGRVFITATAEKRRITVPTAVAAEWWRGRSPLRLRILATVDVEPLDLQLALIAGEAVAAVRGATTVDAIVMASAARRGDVVYTSDFGDLDRLRSVFPNVRVISV